MEPDTVMGYIQEGGVEAVLVLIVFVVLAVCRVLWNRLVHVTDQCHEKDLETLKALESIRQVMQLMTERLGNGNR